MHKEGGDEEANPYPLRKKGEAEVVRFYETGWSEDARDWDESIGMSQHAGFRGMLSKDQFVVHIMVRERSSVPLPPPLCFHCRSLTFHCLSLCSHCLSAPKQW